MASKPAGSKWTDDQWAGISTTGLSLLVSAAAGSGKTAVLAERCAHLVCDAKPYCDVDELLVVTFTEAAAAEMKARIEKALRERIATSHDPRLARQLALIDRAQVSTLHGFCSRLIRQHFHLLDLDPSFIVIDGDEASLLRTEVARELFDERYEAEDPTAFQALIDAYADGYDQRLMGKVVQAHNLLCSLVEPQDWIAAARSRIEQATGGDLLQSKLGDELRTEVRSRLVGLWRSCQQGIAVLSAMKGFEKYLADLRQCEQIVRHWGEVLKSDGIDALAEEVNVDLPRLPSVPESMPGKKLAKALVDRVRDEIKGGTVRQILSFTTQQWRDGLVAVAPHAGVFLDLVNAFGQRYAAAKAALRGVDFADLERLALRVLRQEEKNRDGSYLFPSAVARLMQKQFAHVLVDEYQDINEVQDAILGLVSGESNLFCVGDVKQSIYRFRLAEPTRFLNRQERFRDKKDVKGQVIDLRSNFRSRAPLLETLNGVFERLMTRDAGGIEYDRSHRLEPGAPFPPGDDSCFTGSPIELHLLPAKLEAEEEAHAEADAIAEPDRAQREAILIARRIRQLVDGEDKCPPMRVFDKDAKEFRPIAYGDIVILLRSMRFKGDEYAEVLRRSGIPVHTDSSTGYFDSMEVMDVLSLLKVLDNRAQDIPLAAVLRSPIASLPDAEDALARIHLAFKDEPFHRAVIRYADERDDELAAKLKDVIAQLDRWRQMAQRRPLAELIWDVYDSSGYLAFCAGLRDGEQRKANLIDLHDRARQFGSFQRQGLSRFLDLLDQLREQSDLGQPPVVSEGENVVRIMTIHHSKGLEFPVVILPDLGKRINLQDCSGSILFDRHAYLGMDVVDEERQVRYPSLASTLVSARLRRQSMAEELRVLYVAMTRAKEHLIGVGTCKEDAEEEWSARWSGHIGPIPADEVVSATCMLDWLGPVAAAMTKATQQPIQIIRHSADEVRSWPTPESLRPAEGERQRRLAALTPLDPAPATDPVAEEVIARLTAEYKFQRFTEIPAVEAATTMTKSPRGLGVSPELASGRKLGRDAQATNAQATGGTLELPRAVRTEIKPSAADVGEATHLVLQHVDFASPCDISNLKSQISDLISRRLISPAAASSVDLESICWLIGSPVGELLRKHAASLRRELPIYFAMPAEEFDSQARSADPQDRVMIRSRLDVLVPTPGGLEIVDYKTDRVANTDLYRGQMDLYRRAIKEMTGQPVAAVHVVFLTARHIETI